jgi:hypothetical protein
MADNKKSFILYTHLKSVVEKLITKDREDGTNNSGELFYHILEYVNDEDPKPSNFIIEMAFEPIKLQLKRDFEKWEDIRAKRVEAGKIGGIRSGKTRSKTKQTKQVLNLLSKTKQNEANEAVNVNVNVNVSVNDIKERVIKKEIEFKESIEPFIPIYGKDICNNFYLYWSEPNKSKTKLRYEMEKTWDVERRLANWANRDKAFNTRINGTGAEPHYQKL